MRLYGLVATRLGISPNEVDAMDWAYAEDLIEYWAAETRGQESGSERVPLSKIAERFGGKTVPR